MTLTVNSNTTLYLSDFPIDIQKINLAAAFSSRLSHNLHILQHYRLPNLLTQLYQTAAIPIISIT